MADTTKTLRRRYADALLAKGLRAFPLKSNSKMPARKGWQEQAAARDPAPWANGRDRNIGVATGGRLMVVDIDMKNDVDGEANWAALGVPESAFQVRTPTGGRHIYYSLPRAWAGKVRNSASKLAKGVDVRGEGGYVAGPGTELDGKMYAVINKGAAIERAPKKLLALLKKSPTRDDREREREKESGVKLDTEGAVAQAEDYLSNNAQESIEGAGGNENAFGVAARVRDMGISRERCVDLMLGDWNERCSPPWGAKELDVVVRNAYRYATGKLGGDTPEVQFADEPDSAAPVRRKPSRVEAMNDRYALVSIGGKHAIVEEYLDDKGRERIETYSEPTFHRMTVDQRYTDDDGNVHYVSKEWIMSPTRRTFRGLTFDPSQVGASNGRYNLWKGFHYAPLAGVGQKAARKKCSLFLDHILEVVCAGDQKSYAWLLNHFAHLAQYPARKPETAIVVVGKKGAGKSLMFDVIGQLVRDNYVITADKRMMLGNFNSHMENVLAFQFEEAFWAGDKSAEGKLKLLITGKHHIIERKGYEPFTVPNFARIYITSNEGWVVPASTDERRFTVLECSDGRIGDKAYFNAIYAQLESGGGEGYRALMTYLLAVKVDKTAVHVPLVTAALSEQKVASLAPHARWMMSSLIEGQWMELEGRGNFHDRDDAGFGGRVGVHELYEAYRRFANDLGFRYPGDVRAFGSQMKTIFGKHLMRKRSTVGGTRRVYYYVIPDLEKTRKIFEEWFGSEINWDE